MMKLLRRMIATAFLGFAPFAVASPCLPGTLADYISLAAGCEIGSTLFAGFYVAPGQAAATPIDPGLVQVMPTGSAADPGLTFVLDLDALGGEFFESFFHYQVLAAAGVELTGASLALDGSSAAGDGVAIAVQDLCLDGTFAMFEPVGCTGTPLALLAVALEEFSSNDSALFAGVSFIDVFVDLSVDGGLTGLAVLGSGTAQYATTAMGTVPEPSTLALVLLALAVAACTRRDAGIGGRHRRMRPPPTRRDTMRGVAALAVLASIGAPPAFADHREAPLTVFDRSADITGVYAFRSYDGGSFPRVALIMSVDPFLEPANGPNWFPFDPEILYEIKIDNNNDAVADIVFQFRFTTEQRLPGLYQGYAGAGAGIVAPANSPPPVAPGTPVVPPQITSFASDGLGQRQSYTVTMVKGGIATPIVAAGPFYAVPANAGPRTMNYSQLFNAAIYTTTLPNVRVFAGTTDDASFADLGGFFDTLNTSKVPPVLTPVEDAQNANVAADSFSGYAVNSIAIEVPVSLLTRTGAIEPASSTAATIGVWATTSRKSTTYRRAPLPPVSSGSWSQVQRMGNPLINTVLIGTASKDRFSMEQPKNDAQFASFVLDPTLARILNATTGGAIPIPAPPRTDLLPLVTYAPPIAAPGTAAGPVADLLRLNTGVAPTLPASTSFNRLGLLGGDAAGFPNGRRVVDDVLDIGLRLVAGVLNPSFNVFPNNRLGDAVNVNDAPMRTTFPYLSDAPSGRSRRHIDPGEPLCTMNGGAPCSP